MKKEKGERGIWGVLRHGADNKKTMRFAPVLMRSTISTFGVANLRVIPVLVSSRSGAYFDWLIPDDSNSPS